MSCGCWCLSAGPAVVESRHIGSAGRGMGTALLWGGTFCEVRSWSLRWSRRWSGASNSQRLYNIGGQGTGLEFCWKRFWKLGGPKSRDQTNGRAEAFTSTVYWYTITAVDN